MFDSLRDNFSWKINGKEIQKDAERICEVSYLGGDLILIRGSLGKAISTDYLASEKWTRKWFNCIEEWSDQVIHRKRIIWTIWDGVPLRAWGPRFFKKVSAKFETFLQMDDATTLKQNLSRARIQLKTPLANLKGSPRRMGLEKREKRRDPKELIHETRAEFCCLQETKLEAVNDYIVKSIWGNSICDWDYAESEGSSGGLISIWNSMIFRKVSSWKTKELLVVNGFCVDDGKECIVINIYAPNTASNRNAIWDQLSIIVNQKKGRR